MFYRVGKINCKPEKADDVIDYFKDNEVFFKETDGIQSLSYFKTSANEVTGIAVWESKEKLDANVERVQSIMKGLFKYIEEPPIISEGKLEYQFLKKL